MQAIGVAGLCESARNIADIHSELIPPRRGTVGASSKPNASYRIGKLGSSRFEVAFHVPSWTT